MKKVQVCYGKEKTVQVCTMPLWVWKLTGRKPFNKLGGFIIMEYQCDPKCEKSGLWHLWSAFRAWFKFGRVRG